MDTKEKTIITVEATVDAPVTKVWDCWTDPKHVVKWNFASEDWCTTAATNDLRVGGRFTSRMEAKDGSVGFDFSGVYDQITPHQLIAYTIEDGRQVKITFSSSGSKTVVSESFEAEATNSHDLQRGGWQAILNNFKKYVEQGK